MKWIKSLVGINILAGIILIVMVTVFTPKTVIGSTNMVTTSTPTPTTLPTKMPQQAPKATPVTTELPAPQPTVAPDTRCLVWIDGQGYDVTQFRLIHGGGDIFSCGKDMSVVFHNQHPDTYLQRMAQYKLP